MRKIQQLSMILDALKNDVETKDIPENFRLEEVTYPKEENIAHAKIILCVGTDNEHEILRKYKFEDNVAILIKEQGE